MEILELLGVAVGLASLAGFNLYLTVFLTGLAVRFDWITLVPAYEKLGVLADPVVLVVSGVLFAMEFMADKVPWVDSAWDAVHTAIRPVGAALLAILVLGDSDPVFNVVVALLAAWLGFTTHALKATVRLQANASPEPFTNIALSVAEDATVVLGLGLIFHYPLVALGVAVIFLATVWFFVPRMLRATWVKLWLCARKLRLAADEAPVDSLPDGLPSAAKRAVLDVAGPGWRIAWAVPCISGTGPGFPRNRFGWLVMADGSAPLMYFATRRRRPYALPPGAPVAARIERKFLADVLVLSWPGDGPPARFLFDRGSRALAARTAGDLVSHAAA
ncbi:MAG: DUF4126 domain-containing protein [Chthoniobacterales bacterium]|jgi:hypothetical protein|nr:DUF4126 domain-containing protein [Chthoniobacterales bacterium]